MTRVAPENQFPVLAVMSSLSYGEAAGACMKYVSRKNRPTLSRVQELLVYLPESGRLAWRLLGGNKKNSLAGSLDTLGYRRVMIDGVTQSEHHIIWLLAYGEWPASEIDHINRTRSDNRLANLRLVDRSLQMANASIRSDNKTGYKGISINKRRQAQGKPCVHAYINYKGCRKHLGFHSSVEEAAAARKHAAVSLFGEYYAD